MDQGDLQQLWLVRRRFGESRRKELTRSLRNDYLVGWPWGLSFSSHTLSVLTCAPLALRRCASDSLIYPSLNAKLCIGIPCLGGAGVGTAHRSGRPRCRGSGPRLGAPAHTNRHRPAAARVPPRLSAPESHSARARAGARSGVGRAAAKRKARMAHGVGARHAAPFV